MSSLICVCQVSTVWDLLGFALILLIQCRWSEPVFCCLRGGNSLDFHHSMESFLSAKDKGSRALCAIESVSNCIHQQGQTLERSAIVGFYAGLTVSLPYVMNNLLS